MNPYAIPPLVALMFNAYLGVYVLHQNIKARANRVFGFMMFLMCIFAFTTFMLLGSASQGTALLWCRVTSIVLVFLPAVFLHFALVFPKERRFAKNVGYAFALYIPSLVFAGLVNTNLFVEKVQRYYWGFYSVAGMAFYFYVVCATWFLVYGFFILIKSYRISKGLERDQTRSIIIGMGVVAVVAAATDYGPMVLNMLYLPPLTTWSMILMSCIIAYGIVRYKLMIISPAAEAAVESPIKYELKPSYSYLVKSEDPTRCYEIFKDQVVHGTYGLCITKMPPRVVRDTYGLKKTPLIWLTFKDEITDEKTLPVDKCDELTETISRYIRDAKGSVILIDCLDEIKSVNGFKKTLGFLMAMKSLCKADNSSQLLFAHPKRFTKDQLEMIESQVEETWG